MAKMFPDLEKTRVIFASRAEEHFYQSCLDQLSDEYRVYYSCTLSTIEKNEGLIDSEIDFLIYHPKFGVLVVEVKGGRISFDAEKGEYKSRNRVGREFRIRNPFQQALVWKSRFVREIRALKIKVPVSHAVCFPTVAREDLPNTAEMEKNLLIDRKGIQNLTTSIKAIATISHPKEYLSFKDVGDELNRFIVGSTFSTRLYIRDYIEAHETRVKDFETIHETLITPVAGSKKLGVEGEAGTGKTMLAIMLAKHFLAEGERILFLSSNPLLNGMIKKQLGEDVEVITYTEFAGGFGVDLLREPDNYDGKREDWVQYDGPEALKSAIEKSEVRYSVLICDEAQDVQPFWWEAIEHVLAKNSDSRTYVFFDRNQGVFGSGGKYNRFVAEEVLPVEPPYFPLVHNYRTTREIASFSRVFRTGKAVLRSHCGRIGYVPEIVVYKDQQDCRVQLENLLSRLLREEGVLTSEVAVLSARNPDANESSIKDFNNVKGYSLVRVGGRGAVWPPEAGKIGVSTVAGFKGLETPIGILLNFSEYNLPVENPIMASLIYVACTRAKHMLYVFVKEGSAKQAAFNDALRQIEAKGSMIVEGSDADFEFVGEVVFYDPERFGWLKVEDTAFQQDNILVFPSDAKLADLKLVSGKKVRFRPRVSAGMTFASELRKTDE